MRNPFRQKKSYLTAKTLEEVLAWVESKSHHQAEVINQKKENKFKLSGYHDVIMIPASLWAAADRLVDNGHHFDTRMYRLNAKGRKYLRDRGIIVDKDGKVHDTSSSVSAPKTVTTMGKFEQAVARSERKFHARWEFPTAAFLTGRRVEDNEVRQAFYLFTTANGNHICVGASGAKYEFKPEVTVVPDENVLPSSSERKMQDGLRNRFENTSMVRMMRYADDLISAA